MNVQCGNVSSTINDAYPAVENAQTYSIARTTCMRYVLHIAIWTFIFGVVNMWLLWPWYIYSWTKLKEWFAVFNSV